MIVTIIIIIVVVYRIKKDKYPCMYIRNINKGKLFYICSYVYIYKCTNNYNGLQYSSLTGYTCIHIHVCLESLYHELQQTLMVRPIQHKS